MTGKALILQADARALPLPDASVDLIVTSPPYWGLRSYRDGGQHYADQIGAETTPWEYLENLIACTAEMARVLKPSGSIFINLGDKYSSPGGHTDNTAPSRLEGRRNLRKQGRADRSTATYGVPAKSLMLLPERFRIACVDKLGLLVRAKLVWDKPNGLPERVTDRVRQSHEDWVHLTLRPRYFAEMDSIREPASGYSRPPGARRQTPGGQKRRAMTDTCNPAGRLPGSVWQIPTEPLVAPEHVGVEHYAAFPTAWPRLIISAWCPPGGIVLDPFGGTGTTALVARALGRTGISIDRSADYCRLAAWRTNDRAELAKALRVDKPPVEMAGQADILAELEHAGRSDVPG